MHKFKKFLKMIYISLLKIGEYRAATTFASTLITYDKSFQHCNVTDLSKVILNKSKCDQLNDFINKKTQLT